MLVRNEVRTATYSIMSGLSGDFTASCWTLVIRLVSNQGCLGHAGSKLVFARVS